MQNKLPNSNDDSDTHRQLVGFNKLPSRMSDYYYFKGVPNHTLIFTLFYWKNSHNFIILIYLLMEILLQIYLFK